MKGRDIAWRAAGVASLAIAAASTLAHRIVNGQPAGAAPLAEGALTLASFLFASYGVLLLIHSGRLHRRERPTRPDQRLSAVPPARRATRPGRRRR